MRISDWSSDVCSSDLLPLSDRSADAGKRHPSLHIQTVAKSSSRGRGRAGYATTAYGQAVPPQLPARRGARSRPGGPRQSQMAASELLGLGRSEEHTSELQSLMRISYAVFCLKKKKKHITNQQTYKKTTK